MHCIYCGAPVYGMTPATSVCYRCRSLMAAEKAGPPTRAALIPATPPVSGVDAEALIASLEKCATPEEMARRIWEAKQRLKPRADGSVEYAVRRPAPAAESTASEKPRTQIPNATEVDVPSPSAPVTKPENGKHNGGGQPFSLENYAHYQKARGIIHDLWAKAAQHPDYDQEQWLALENQIRLLADDDVTPTAFPMVAPGARQPASLPSLAEVAAAIPIAEIAAMMPGAIAMAETAPATPAEPATPATPATPTQPDPALPAPAAE